jgi:hypothetical protein
VEIHPDRFSDEEAKKTANAKFTEAQELLSELFQYIQDEAAHRTPAELVLFKPLYDSVFLQHALDASRTEISELKTSLEWSEREVEELKTSLKKRDDDHFDDERKRIQKMYLPSTTSWASLGIIFVLSFLLTAMSKVKNVSDFISQYSPFSQNLMNTTLFIVLIIMIVLTLKRYVENV